MILHRVGLETTILVRRVDQFTDEEINRYQHSFFLLEQPDQGWGLLFSDGLGHCWGYNCQGLKMDIRHLQLQLPTKKDSEYFALRVLLQVASQLPSNSQELPRLHVLDEIPTTLLPTRLR